MSNLEQLKHAGVDISRLPKLKASMTETRWADISYLFHTCDYDFDKLEKKIEELNRIAIAINVCSVCGKVDINLMSHWRTCDPVGEQYRRESQEVYWK